MKKLLLILLALPLLVISQEAAWHPLPSQQICLFGLSESNPGNVYPIRIDSIINEGGQQIYYNVRTPQKVGDNDETLVYYDPYQSWIGYSTRFQNQIAYFQNIEGEEIPICYQYEINQPWILYTGASGVYFEAQIASLGVMEILTGLSDSVKYITLQAYNEDGSFLDHAINSDTLILSKNYGFIRTFSFASFSLQHQAKKNLISLDIEAEHYGYQNIYDEMVTAYEVGDIIHIERGTSSSKYEIISKIITENYVEYSIEVYSSNGNQNLFTKRFYLNKLPKESLFNELGFNSIIMGSTWLDKQEYVIEYYRNLFERTYNGQYVWGAEEISIDYYPGYSRCNDVFTYLYLWSETMYANLVYYKNSDEEWGEPLEFDVPDYQPIRPDMVSYYGRRLNGDISYSDIKVIKTDSIINGIYYNTRSPEVVEYGGDNDYYDPFSSWIGEKTIINGSESVFENIDGEEIFIHSQENSNTPWLFFQNDDGSYIDAQISMTNESEILPGLTDSLKHITFQAYNSSGTAIDNSINSDTIVLSKSHGWVSTFYFAEFSMNHHPIHTLMGIEKQDDVFGFVWEFPNMTNNYQVDDEVNLFTDEGNEIKLVIDDKQYIGEYVKYTCTQCEKNFDGTTTSSQKTFIYKTNVLPGQTILSDGDDTQQGFYSFSLYRDLWLDETQYLVRFYTGSSMEETEFNGQYAWAHEVNGTNSYNPYYYKSNYIWTFLYAVHEDRTYDLVYYNNALEEWGEELDFACNTGYNEFEKAQLSISPNPSNGIFSLIYNTSKNMEEITVFNTKGDIVWQKEAQGNEQNIDISFLPNGLYLLKVSLEDNQVVSEKIVINN